MFHPVGTQPSSVYWRRRLVLGFAVVALLALIVVTAKVVLGGGGATPVASGSSTTSTHTPSAPATSSSVTTRTSTSTSSSPVSSPPDSGAGSGSAMPQPCTASQLAIAATTGAPSYAVGAQPVLSLQVTDTGPAACTQNLADSQVVLTVYNGLSRVWGSHDCEIQPGTDVRTLAVNTPVAISVVWSGRSSQPACAGVRQQVGVGSYTLIPALSGHNGKAAQFAIH